MDNSAEKIRFVRALAIRHTKVNNWSRAEMFALAVVQTKVISCNGANKSCLLQVMQTKAIAALTQFCDWEKPNVSKKDALEAPSDCNKFKTRPTMLPHI